MKRRIIVKEAARADLGLLAEHIAQTSLRAALRLFQAADRSFEKLAEAPDRGSLCGFRRSESRDVRVWSVRDFPKHLIFYRATDDRIEILRVLHGARDAAAIFEPWREADDVR